MFQSHRYSELLIRLGLAAVFLWCAINKFLEPQRWIDSLTLSRIPDALTGAGMNATNLVTLLGILEVLIAASLVTGFFRRWFAALGVLVLVAVALAQGIAESPVSVIGLLGALAALVIWPERHYA